MAKNSLADKINALITTKPDFGSDEEPEETKAKVVERYDESDASDDKQPQQISKIRKQNIDTLDHLDERYVGKKVSRKDIYGEDVENESEEDERDEEDEQDEQDEEDEIDEEDEANKEEKNISEQSDDDLDDSKETDSQQSEDSENDDEDAEDAENISNMQDQDDYDITANKSLDKREKFTIKTMSKTNVKAEREKGNCVRNQLKLWENLLEIRIKLQKCIVTSNQMPQHDTHVKYRSDAKFAQTINETKGKLAQILNNMLQLKDLLLKQYPETKTLQIGSKRKKIEENNEDDSMDEEIPSDTEDELGSEKESSANEDAKEPKEPVPRKLPKFNDYEKIIAQGHNSYAQYRDSIIRKWNEKTRITTGTFNKNSGQTTLKQIEFAMDNISKLRKKTQLKRSEYNILGKSTSVEDDNNDGNKVQEYDSEIFDDDDFYHQLLRDLIEYKSLNVTDPVQLSRHWIQLQNMRRKMKRKVDTRATKGRKVRYTVHNKLVNYMAPVTVYDMWTSNAKNELYSSLFGKIKSSKEKTK